MFPLLVIQLIHGFERTTWNQAGGKARFVGSEGGKHQHSLAFCLLVVHDIHKNLFSGFSIANLEDAQNQTIICNNYSITLCSRVSIIPPDREHASLLLQASWTFRAPGRSSCGRHETCQTDN